ncbi:unnamed protein product, partial [Amoebophrya sp. A25]
WNGPSASLTEPGFFQLSSEQVKKREELSLFSRVGEEPASFLEFLTPFCGAHTNSTRTSLEKHKHGLFSFGNTSLPALARTDDRTPRTIQP